MTRIRKTGNSSMVQDRRGSGGGGGGLFGGLGGGGGGGIPLPGKLGGGVVGLLVTLAVLFLPRLLSGEASNLSSGSGTPPPNVADGACNDELESILCGATEDVQGFWDREFTSRGEEYTVTQTVFFSGATNTGCGQASSQTGPFYCPADSLVYFDLEFLVQLQQQFDANGDLAAQYIVAHEYGHHVQNLLGINAETRRAQERDPSRANEYSVALELQADCFAGMWAHDVRGRNLFESDREIDEALKAAAAVGDDRIQQQTQGRVDPETFTHGSSEQRVQWFKRGYTTGDRSSCDTFSEIVG